jgi:hypothetical protein
MRVAHAEHSSYLANPTSLLTPDGTSRQILVETAGYGEKCLARSYQQSALNEGQGNKYYRFVPLDGHTGAIDVGGGSVLKVFEARVSRFLWRY